MIETCKDITLPRSLLAVKIKLRFCYRTGGTGYVGLPKEARELLANLTVGSTDIQPPGMFHYLPHLIGKPEGLRPSHKISQSRRGGD